MSDTIQFDVSIWYCKPVVRDCVVRSEAQLLAKFVILTVKYNLNKLIHLGEKWWWASSLFFFSFIYFSWWQASPLTARPSYEPWNKSEKNKNVYVNSVLNIHTRWQCGQRSYLLLRVSLASLMTPYCLHIASYLV